MARAAVRRGEALLAGPFNTKLGRAVWSWLVPAIRTCPGATEFCKALCYVLKGHFLFEANQERYERNLERSRRPDFVRKVVGEIRRDLVPVVRIHASGDFYDADYTRKWIQIARACPETTFFAYTRSWSDPKILAPLKVLSRLPNMYLWWSEDRDSVGKSPRTDDVRVCFLVKDKTDEALVDPELHDLVFRDRSHRAIKVSGVKPLKQIAGTTVCPYEQWYVWNVNMKQHREPPRFQCTTCRICFTPAKGAGARRVDVRALLADPRLRRELMVETIVATQAREGVETTRAQAEAAYDRVQLERARKERP